MSRYLEYEIASGRILSEVTSETDPEAVEGIGFLEVSGDTDINTSLYVVKCGQLVSLSEEAERRAERERLKHEKADQIRQRLRSMVYEVNIAILEEDDAALSELRREYRELKVYLR